MYEKSEQTILSRYVQEEAKERLRIKHSRKKEFGWTEEKGFEKEEDYKNWADATKNEI